MLYSLGKVVRKVRPTISVSTDLPATRHFNALNAVVETYASGGPIETLRTTGSIVYTQGDKRHPKRSNFCAHNISSMKLISDGLPMSRIADLNPAHVGWTWEPYWDYAVASSAHTSAITTALAALGAVGLTKLQANWYSYAVSGFTALQPDLTKLSLPNFLVDLKQIGSLADDVRPFMNLVSAEAKTQRLVDLNRYRALSGKDQLKSASKLVASKRLSYKFGWKPTIGDVTAMLDAVLGLKDRLEAFKNSIGVDLSYTKTLENVDTWKTGQFNYGGFNYYPTNWAGYLKGKVQYHAKYTPQPLAVLGPLDEKIRAVLDHFGVELNPQILWDAIPLSFVLDWFTGFGDWLGNFKVDALQLPILLTDSAVSYKETYQVNSRLITNPSGFAFVTAPHTLPGFSSESRFYHRMPVDPSVATMRQLGWKRPTKSQWINFVSLATVLGL
jgi:hypothetical protein